MVTKSLLYIHNLRAKRYAWSNPIRFTFRQLNGIFYARASKPAQHAHWCSGAFSARERRQIFWCVFPRNVLTFCNGTAPCFGCMHSHHINHLLHGDINSFGSNRCDWVLRNATRNNVGCHVLKISMNVDGKPVHRATTTNANTNGTNLARCCSVNIKPHTGVTTESGRIGKPNFMQCINNYLLNCMYIRRRIWRRVVAVLSLQCQ